MDVDQERVRNLLKETVILLCKNGLKFRTEVKVQGLLGITLDNKDIFLVQIDEKIYEPINIDLLKKEDDDDVNMRTEFQTINCREPTKQTPGTNQDWHEELASAVVTVENVNNDVRFQDSEVCSTFSNSVSLSGAQSFSISRSTTGSIHRRKSENHEQPMDNVPLKPQNSEMYATQFMASLPAVVSSQTVNVGNMSKPTRFAHNRSHWSSETLGFTGSRLNKRKLVKNFSPSLMNVNSAPQVTLYEESCQSLEGINERLYNTIEEPRTALESPNYSATGGLMYIHKNQSLDGYLSKINRLRGSRSSTLSYVSHENLQALLLRREKTRLRVKKHRLKKKLELLAIKNEPSE